MLVGDPGQLTSIEAGAVLGDIVRAGGDGVVVLEHVYRYGAGIDEVAAAIRKGDGDAVIAALPSRACDVTGSRWTSATPRPTRRWLRSARARWAPPRP